MGYIQNAKPGVGAVGEYQAAGRPWIKTVRIPAASQANLSDLGALAEDGVGELRVDFPAVTKRVIIRNISGASVTLHFASLATTNDGLAAGAANSAVKNTKNYIKIPDGASLDLSIKCRFIFLSKENNGNRDVEVIAELTNIQEPYDLNRKGLSGVTV